MPGRSRLREIASVRFTLDSIDGTTSDEVLVGVSRVMNTFRTSSIGLREESIHV